MTFYLERLMSCKENSKRFVSNFKNTIKLKWKSNPTCMHVYKKIQLFFLFVENSAYQLIKKSKAHIYDYTKTWKHIVPCEFNSAYN